METIDLSKCPFGTLVELRNGEEGVFLGNFEAPKLGNVYLLAFQICGNDYYRSDGSQVHNRKEYDIVRILSVPQPPCEKKEKEHQESIEAWMARDSDGKLYLYEGKPYVYENWSWISDAGAFASLNSKLFPSVQWEDEKPTKVKITIENYET